MHLQRSQLFKLDDAGFFFFLHINNLSFFVFNLCLYFYIINIKYKLKEHSDFFFSSLWIVRNSDLAILEPCEYIFLEINITAFYVLRSFGIIAADYTLFLALLICKKFSVTIHGHWILPLQISRAELQLHFVKARTNNQRLNNAELIFVLLVSTQYFEASEWISCHFFFLLIFLAPLIFYGFCAL